MNKICLFAAVLLLVPAAWAKMPLNLAGTSTLSFENVFYSDDADSDTTTTLIDGIKVPVRLVLMGRTKPMDFNLVSNFYYNQWNDLRFDLVTLNAKGQVAGKDYRFVLGDAYVRHRPLTIMNRKVRGLTGDISLLKDNTRDLLNLQLIGGFSKEAQEEGAPVANPIYRRSATTGQYRQLFTGAIVKYPPFPGFNAELIGLYAKDDAGSIDSSATGIQNTLYGAHLDYWFLDKRVSLDGDFNFSSYDDDIQDTDEAVSDKAIRLSLDGRINQYKFKGVFRYIGPDYFTAGYPYLETDRLGFSGEFGYTLKGLLQSGLQYDYYKDNLANDSTDHTITTNIVKADVTTAWNRNPNLNAAYTLKREKSPLKTDNTLVDRTSHTVGGGFDLKFSQVRGSFSVSDKIILDDSQLYLKNTTSVDFTIYDVTNQLSFSTSLRYRPSRAVSLLGGASNVFSTVTGRDGVKETTLINYYYFSAIGNLAKGKYRPTLDVVYSNYKPEVYNDNTEMVKIKTALEYRLTRAQSAKLYYIFEDAFKVENNTKVNDYLANSIGLEYTLIF